MEGVGSTIVASFERAPWGWGVFLLLLTTIVRGWPAISDAATRAKTALGDRRASRIEKLEETIVAMGLKVDAVTAQSHQIEMKLVSALAAYRLIASELQKFDPNSPILKQAQELLNVSYSMPRAVTTPADTIRQPEPKGGRNS